MTPARRIVVHYLGHARAALAAAESLGLPVTLMSPYAASGYLGPAFFADIVELARAEHPGVAVEAILDCGDAAGDALAALRHGLKAIRVDLRPDVRAKIADIAEQLGARLDDEESPECLDLLDLRDPEKACREWLKGGAAVG